MLSGCGSELMMLFQSLYLMIGGVFRLMCLCRLSLLWIVL